MISNDKAGFILLINQYRSSNLSSVVKFITFFGDGVFVLVLAFVLLFFKYLDALILLIAYSVSGLAAQFFKKVVFVDHMRPKFYLENHRDMQEIDWSEHHSQFSYPSGHTTTAFTILLILTIINRNKSLGYLYATLAIMVGLSRVYLLQHFLEDVIAGAVLGIILTSFTYLIAEHKLSRYQMLKGAIFKKSK